MFFRKKKKSRPDTRPERVMGLQLINLEIIRNGLHGRVAVKKQFFRKENKEKRLGYAK